MSKEDFTAQSDLVQEKPLNDDSLAYKIRLPKGWTKMEVKDFGSDGSGAGVFQTLANYASPPRIEHQSLFRIRVSKEESLIALDDWFIGYITEMGLAIEGMIVKSPNLLIAQYTVFEDNEPYVVRAVVARSGSRILFAEYLMPQDIARVEKDLQIWSVASFELVTPAKDSPVDMETYYFVNVAKFDYPSNWTIQTFPVRDVMRMGASIVNGNGQKNDDGPGGHDQLSGIVDVSVIAKNAGTTPADEIQKLNEDLKKKNLKLGAFIGTVPVDGIRPDIKSARVDAYDVDGASKKLAGYEFWVAVTQTDTHYYLVRLITLSRTENFVMWARNVASFKAVVRSLGPASDAASNAVPDATSNQASHP